LEPSAEQKLRPGKVAKSQAGARGPVNTEPDPLVPLRTRSTPAWSWSYPRAPSPARPAGLDMAVHIGEGDDLVVRPLGPVNVNSSLASPCALHPLLCIRWWWKVQSSARLGMSVDPPMLHHVR
jgi:hypothetical protein